MAKMTKTAKKKYRDRWAVLQIYNEDDGAQPLVHVIEVFDTKAKARKRCRESAKDMLADFNEGLPKGEKAKFDEIWEQVDNCEEDEFSDWGYDPSYDTICWRLRVRLFTEEA